MVRKNKTNEKTKFVNEFKTALKDLREGKFIEVKNNIKYLGQVTCEDKHCYQFLSDKFALDHPNLVTHTIEVIKTHQPKKLSKQEITKQSRKARR